MKSSLVDILNVLYSKENKELKNDNIYNKSLESIYDEILSRKLKIENVFKKHYYEPLQSDSDIIDTISQEKLLKDEQLEKELYIKQESGVYSRNYINLHKSEIEELIKSMQLSKEKKELETIYNSFVDALEDFKTRFTGKMKNVIPGVINIFIGFTRKLIDKDKEDEQKTLLNYKIAIGNLINLVRYFSIQPYGVDVIDEKFLKLQSSMLIFEDDRTSSFYSIEQNGENIEIKVRYFLGEVDEYRFKGFTSKDEVIKYIALQDSYMFMHKYLKIKTGDIYFLLDLYDYFEKIRENFRISFKDWKDYDSFDKILEGILTVIKNSLKNFYNLDLDKLENIIEEAYEKEQNSVDKKIIKGYIAADPEINQV